MLTLRRSALGVASVTLAVSAAGCGFVPGLAPDAKLTIVNNGTRAATFDVVEFDFVSGETGDSLGSEVPPLSPGDTATTDLTFPDEGSWAFMINDIPAVLSFEVADRMREMPGDGPLVYDISVHDDGLETSVSRGDDGGMSGVTSAPMVTPP